MQSSFWQTWLGRSKKKKSPLIGHVWTMTIADRDVCFGEFTRRCIFLSCSNKTTSSVATQNMLKQSISIHRPRTTFLCVICPHSTPVSGVTSENIQNFRLTVWYISGRPTWWSLCANSCELQDDWKHRMVPRWLKAQNGPTAATHSNCIWFLWMKWVVLILAISEWHRFVVSRKTDTPQERGRVSLWCPAQSWLPGLDYFARVSSIIIASPWSL